MVRGLDFSFLLRLSAAFFVIGTLASFVTPLGGFVQLGAFVLLTADALMGMPSSTHFSVGVAASFASTVLVVLGFLLPLGIPESSKPSRILTVARISTQHCINMLPIAGAVLGIGSLFVSWASITDLPSHLTFAAHGIDYFVPRNGPELTLGLSDGIVKISVALFLGGCVSGVISPLGGAPQLLGCTLYYVLVRDWIQPGAVTQGSIGFGFFLALTAGSVTMLGLLKGIGIGCSSKDQTTLSHLLVWSLH
jgi:hypothetical protein